MVSSLRSLALKSDGHSALDSRRLSRELSEIDATSTGRDNQAQETAGIEDPTAVVALLNVAGMFRDPM